MIAPLLWPNAKSSASVSDEETESRPSGNRFDGLESIDFEGELASADRELYPITADWAA